MKKTLFSAALVALLAGPAYAYHCPVDMQQIDAALDANPQLSEAELEQVQQLRADGQAAHEAGDHDTAVADLGEAKQILGIE